MIYGDDKQDCSPMNCCDQGNSAVERLGVLFSFRIYTTYIFNASMHRGPSLLYISSGRNVWVGRGMSDPC